MSDEHLTDLERRLAGWRPANEGLDADAMLFAAGRASVRQGPARFAWPAIAACLAIAVGLLGMRWSSERTENQILFARLEYYRVPAPVAAPAAPLSDSNYLVVRRALEVNPDNWPLRIEADAQVPKSPSILRAGQRDPALAP
jgi:hypothetical protein